ncbi:hypothetical protein AALB39_07525 [Lachnospiraceae bacterium 54-53]
MYAYIQKIIINNRIHLQSEFISSIVRKFGIRLTESKLFIIQTILIFFSNLIFISGGIFYIGQHVDKDIFIPILFIIVILIGLIGGTYNYKNIFMFPFYQWYEISPADNKKLYFTLLCVELLFSFIFNGYIAVIVISLIALQGFTLSSLILSINFLSCFLLAYISSSYFWGKYTYTLVTKKIHIFRLLLYLCWAMVILFTMERIISFIYFTFYLSFANIKQPDLLSDKFWYDAFDTIEISFQEYWNVIVEILLQLNEYLNSFIFLGAFILLSTFLLLPIKFIPPTDHIQKFKGDLLNKYISFLEKLGKGSYITKHLLITLNEFRWILVRPFYQVVFLDYEIIFYIGILFSLTTYIENELLQLHFLIILNIQVFINQAFEIRQILAPYFSLSNNINELIFLKVSFGYYPIVKEKEKILRRMLIIPFLIIFFINFLFLLYNSLPLTYLLVFISIDLGYLVIAPSIQTHMLATTVNMNAIGKQFINESFEETELADTLQGIPRIFTNIIPFIITVPFVIFCNNGKYLIFIEVFYLFFSIIFTWNYCNKIQIRGSKKLYDKIK